MHDSLGQALWQVFARLRPAQLTLKLRVMLPGQVALRAGAATRR